jgi:hypothetical protein
LKDVEDKRFPPRGCRARARLDKREGGARLNGRPGRQPHQDVSRLSLDGRLVHGEGSTYREAFSANAASWEARGDAVQVDSSAECGTTLPLVLPR